MAELNRECAQKAAHVLWVMAPPNAAAGLAKIVATVAANCGPETAARFGDMVVEEMHRLGRVVAH